MSLYNILTYILQKLNNYIRETLTNIIIPRYEGLEDQPHHNGL